MITLALATTFVVAAVVTALCVPPLTRLSLREGWVAVPGPRHVHQRTTPSVGGLAMIAGFAVALLLSFTLERLDPALRRSSFEYLRLGLLFTGLSIVAVVSLIDDLRDLAAMPRLAVHVVAALVAVGPYLWQQSLDPEARGIILTAFNFPFVEQIHLHNLSPWLAIGATVFWIVGMQNMVNWADGLDGLAAGVTLIAAMILALHALTLEPAQYTIALLPLALAGACAGFLPFNFHPARTFMGDVGAMALGYILGVASIIGGAKLATALLVMGVPLIDMAWLIAMRTIQGRGATRSGRDHLHHRLLDMGLSQRQVVLIYYGLSAAFGGVALLDVPPVVKLGALALLGTIVVGFLLYATFGRRDAASQRA